VANLGNVALPTQRRIARKLRTGDSPWLTVTDAMAELDELAEAVLGEQGQQLSDIRNFLTSLEAKCTVE
jgi:hypothetical protein